MIPAYFRYRLFDSLAHDGFVRSLSIDEFPESEQKQFLRQIQKELADRNRALKNLHEFSLKNSGDYTKLKSIIDIAQICMKKIDLSEPNAKSLYTIIYLYVLRLGFDLELPHNLIQVFISELISGNLRADLIEDYITVSHYS